MEKVTGTLNAYVEYQCPHCAQRGSYVLESIEVQFGDLDEIQIKCSNCEEDIIIDNIID